jgi:hypothetical protein
MGTRVVLGVCFVGAVAVVLALPWIVFHVCAAIMDWIW